MFLVGEDLFISVSQVRAEDHAVLARDEDERSEHGRDKDDDGDDQEAVLSRAAAGQDNKCGGAGKDLWCGINENK